MSAGAMVDLTRDYCIHMNDMCALQSIGFYARTAHLRVLALRAELWKHHAV